MGRVEHYPDGTFCWVDLGTNDAGGAKAFYGGLFGWEFEDPTPRWGVAFWVADPDQAAARARELGGSVVLAPFDIPVGRFTILADPQGAVITATAVPGGPARGVDGS
jgi:uncharacterized protein